MSSSPRSSPAGALIAAYTVVAAADTSASAKQNAVVVAIGAVVAVGTAFGVSLFTDAQLEAVVGVVVLVFGGTATQRQLVTPRRLTARRSWRHERQVSA